MFPTRKNVLVLASIIVLQLCIKVDAQVKYVHSSCDGRDFNYTQGSVYENNIRLLFDQLTSKISTYKFYNSTVGDSANPVYGLYQCREDVRLRVCYDCVTDATKEILHDCLLYGGAAAYYYECTLWYSGSNILSTYERDPRWYDWSPTNVSNYDHFAPVLATEIEGVINKASSSMPHSASSVADFTVFEKLYSFAQCTPNIDAVECNKCLRLLVTDMLVYANKRTYVMMYVPSCQLRYDMSPIVSTVLTPSPGNNDGKTSKLQPAIIGGIVGGVGFVLLLVAVVLGIFLCRRKPKEMSRDLTPTSPQIATPSTSGGSRDGTAKPDTRNIVTTEFQQYDFATLQYATRDFSAKYKLGEGGFGSVYKGKLGNGENVAVKRLSGTGGQGNKEFMAEAGLLAKLQHRNLVRLVGFCSEGDEKLLVYEYMPNSSLNRFLFDSKRRELFNWELRYKIIMGIARGLQYLHEDSRLTIIHRDLKAANILLDKDMTPKIADFGLAKLFEGVQMIGSTGRIVGTQGYMAPEYMMTGKYSNKSDVYSFGVMLLEIVSGRKNRVYHSSRQEDLSTEVWRLWSEKHSFEITDPVVVNNCSSDDVLRCIQIGLLCLQTKPDERPTMGGVVLMLTGSVALPVPKLPVNYSDDYESSTNSVTIQTEVDMVEDSFPVPR